MLSKSVVTCQKIKSVEKGAFFVLFFFICAVGQTNVIS